MTVAELHQALEKWHADSFGWALHCCHGQQTLAEDVLQTAYLKVLEQKAVFKGKSTFRTWLFSVIRFTAIDAARYQQSKQKREEALQLELERAMKQPSAQSLVDGGCSRPVARHHCRLVDLGSEVTYLASPNC